MHFVSGGVSAAAWDHSCGRQKLQPGRRHSEGAWRGDHPAIRSPVGWDSVLDSAVGPGNMASSRLPNRPTTPEPETDATRAYREHLNSEGSPSEAVASGYRWTPGTEVLNKAA